MMTQFFTSRAFIWTLLALPSLPMLVALYSGHSPDDTKPVAEALLHPTGEFSARFLIITMIISPLVMLFPQSRFWRWMMKRRRYFGLAAFGYAAFHTMLYIIDIESFQALWGAFFLTGIWTGWLALFVFLPLAITSNDWSVKMMGKKWKLLQRLVYLSAIATLLHWIFVHNEFGPALVHFVPLALLEGYRISRQFKTRKIA